MPWQIPWFIALFINVVPWFDRPNNLLPPLILNDDAATDTIANVDHVMHDGGSAIVPVNLSIVNVCVEPDGITRTAVLARKDGQKGENRGISGPIISGYMGDRFLINVTNELNYIKTFTGVTVHWHGIHQYGSSQMDGTAFVTQCPVLPGSSFLYNFTVPDQAGTFWYHSHYGVQYCDGLRGPLIIRDHDDPYLHHLYDFDTDDTVVTLMDWYHYPSVVTPRQIWPDSALMGGVGCYNSSVGCPSPATYMVKWGQLYRFRLLNMACKSWFDFSIDGHVLEVIEADGSLVEPFNVTSIRIFAAQRYSFVPHTLDRRTSFTIRATTNLSADYVLNVNATLLYEDVPEEYVESTGESVSVKPRPLNEADLRPHITNLDSRLLKPVPDISLVVGMNKLLTSTYDFTINGVQYISPDIPVLLQIMKNQSQLAPEGSVYFLPRNQVVEVIFVVDSPGRPHPFHLHGHDFAVIKSAGSNVSNLVDPIMRDTVNTGMTTTENNVTIRFLTDNPGPWFLHCHNEWHLWTGMGILFMEDYASIQNQTVNSQTWSQCPYNNSNDNFPLPPPNPVPGPYSPGPTYTCMP